MSSPTPAFQQILQKFAAEAESVCAQLCAQACGETAARLNQAVRRIRQCASREELGGTVADTAAPFASQSVWLRLDGDAARADKFGLVIPLAEAPALKEAAHSREPVVALAAAAEVSAHLAGEGDARALIYPVVAAGKAVALLYALADPRNAAQSAALELLAQVGSAAWESLAPPTAAAQPAAPTLVTLGPQSAAAPQSKPAGAWDALTPEEQEVHLRAQRFARVQVAEMRLRHSAVVQAGRLRRNLYASLRDSIDAAREAYRKEFFARCPSMVDYLHLELAHTLANDDAEVLGKEYPGPMV